MLIRINKAFVEVTIENYTSLRSAYLSAFNAGTDMFVWNGIELTTMYAGYCLSRMEMGGEIMPGA